jgi:hypothetical protein
MFEWNLIFAKSIHCFYQLIGSSLVAGSNAKPMVIVAICASINRN